MIAHERLIGDNGYEVCLFPCEAMYVTQGEHDVLALDFRALNTQGVRITKMPCYAPFTGSIVYTGNDHNCILQSINKVNTPSGLKYVRVLVAHQDDPPAPVGTDFRQGFKFYETGDYGLSFGEHLHMEYALVDNTSDRLWNTGGVGLYNAVHMWDALYVNDTAIFNGGGFNWKTYEGGVTPPIDEEKKKHKFPWVLYARRLREEM